MKFYKILLNIPLFGIRLVYLGTDTRKQHIWKNLKEYNREMSVKLEPKKENEFPN